MTLGSIQEYFCKVSISFEVFLRVAFSFYGNLFWEDWGGPEKDQGCSTAIVHRLAIVCILDGSGLGGQSRSSSEAYLQVDRCMVRAHSLVSSSLLHPSHWAMSASSFGFITCNYPLLVVLFVLFCFFF